MIHASKVIHVRTYILHLLEKKERKKEQVVCSRLGASCTAKMFMNLKIVQFWKWFAFQKYSFFKMVWISKLFIFYIMNHFQSHEQFSYSWTFFKFVTIFKMWELFYFNKISKITRKNWTSRKNGTKKKRMRAKETELKHLGRPNTALHASVSALNRGSRLHGWKTTPSFAFFISPCMDFRRRTCICCCRACLKKKKKK